MTMNARRFLGPILGVLLVSVALGMSGRSNAQEPDSVTITFNELNNSGVTGTATLTADGDKTKVSLAVSGITGDHPDHIHRSTCADPEPVPTYPLSDVVLSPADELGHSETTVDVPLSTLLTEEHLILIHKSHEEINVYYACADIALTGSVPATGVGTTFSGNGSSSQLAGTLFLAALLLSVAGFKLNRGRRGEMRS
jgi:hypothetical protein